MVVSGAHGHPGLPRVGRVGRRRGAWPVCCGPTPLPSREEPGPRLSARAARQEAGRLSAGPGRGRVTPARAHSPAAPQRAPPPQPPGRPSRAWHLVSVSLGSGGGCQLDKAPSSSGAPTPIRLPLRGLFTRDLPFSGGRDPGTLPFCPPHQTRPPAKAPMEPPRLLPAQPDPCSGWCWSLCPLP